MPAQDRLVDDVAIVTGAGRDIGKTIATTLTREGVSVVVADVDEGSPTEVAAAIEADGGRATPFAVDVTDDALVDSLLADTECRYGSVDIFVNNAAVNERSGLFELTVEEFDRVVAVNLRQPLCPGDVPVHARSRDVHGRLRRRADRERRLGDLGSRRVTGRRRGRHVRVWPPQLLAVGRPGAGGARRPREHALTVPDRLAGWRGRGPIRAGSG